LFQFLYHIFSIDTTQSEFVELNEIAQENGKTTVDIRFKVGQEKREIRINQLTVVLKILVVNRKMKSCHEKDNIEWSCEISETLEVTEARMSLRPDVYDTMH
jgi:hypothetical protein